MTRRYSLGGTFPRARVTTAPKTTKGTGVNGSVLRARKITVGAVAAILLKGLSRCKKESRCAYTPLTLPSPRTPGRG